jgi:hypothetical protein
VKIPKKVKVGPLHYTVKCEKQVSDGSRTLAGQADHDNLTIHLEQCAQEQMEDTFFHESLHCISSTFHIGLSEEQVYVLSPALLAFLKDNRLLRE